MRVLVLYPVRDSSQTGEKLQQILLSLTTRLGPIRSFTPVEKLISTKRYKIQKNEGKTAMVTCMAKNYSNCESPFCHRFSIGGPTHVLDATTFAGTMVQI